LKDFKEIKDAICFSLVNREADKEVLRKYPYIEVLDLAMLFYYKCDKGFKKGAITIISERNRKKWGVSLEQLREVAIENTIRLLPPIFQTIEQMIDGIAEEENLLIEHEEEPLERMYVLTNEEKYLGAGTILYPEVLSKVHAQVKADFFIIPSSLHEVIIMLDVGNVMLSNLENLVAEMNEQFLEADEVLSNNIYRYDSEADELIMM